MKLWDLKPHPKNPRKISKDKLQVLEKSLKHFGDLSGIVINRRTGHVVAGHQRLKCFNKSVELEINDVEKTTTGTVGLGFVDISGEKFSVRIVDWSTSEEDTALLAANFSAGWDYKILPDLLLSLDSENIDLDLSGFPRTEIEDIINFSTAPEVSNNKAVVCPSCKALISQR